MNCIKCGAELPEEAAYCHKCGKKQAPAQRKRRKRANGTGTIYKLQGKRNRPWAAQRNGVYIGAFETYSAAQKALERITDAQITDKYNMTFQQVYDAWNPVHAKTLSKSGAAGYEAAYKSCPELHQSQFRSLRKSDFQAVITRLEASGKSKSTCEKVLQLFGQLSKWAVEEEIVQRNHAKAVVITAKQKSTRAPFTAAEIEAINNSHLPAAQIALILIGTGCRPNELFNAPLSMCHSNYFIGGSKTKAGKNRVIAVSPIGLPAYQSLLESARASGGSRLIDGYAGNRAAANYTKRDFKTLMEEVGSQGMTPYNCRHTFVTLAVKSGVRPELLKRMVGHESYDVTDTYTHLGVEDILDAVKQIDTSLTVTNKLQTQQKAAGEN